MTSLKLYDSTDFVVVRSCLLYKKKPTRKGVQVRTINIGQDLGGGWVVWVGGWYTGSKKNRE